MSVADTSVLVALLDAQHPLHARSQDLLATGPISVSPPTMAELTRIIRRHASASGRNGNKVARRAVELLRSIPGYRLAATPPEAEVAKAYAGDARLSYTDAWNIVTSIRSEDALVTLDAVQRRAYARMTRSTADERSR